MHKPIKIKHSISANKLKKSESKIVQKLSNFDSVQKIEEPKIEDISIEDQQASNKEI